MLYGSFKEPPVLLDKTGKPLIDPNRAPFKIEDDTSSIPAIRPEEKPKHKFRSNAVQAEVGLREDLRVLGDVWKQTHDVSQEGQGTDDLKYERLKIFSKWWAYIIKDSPVHGAVMEEIKEAYDSALDSSRRRGMETSKAASIAHRPEQDQRIETEVLPEGRAVSAPHDAGGAKDEAKKREEEQAKREHLSTGTNASLLQELARLQNMVEEKDTLVDELQQQLLDSNPVTSTPATSPLNRR